MDIRRFFTQSDPTDTTMTTTVPIPQPPWIPLIGNAHELDSEVPQTSFNLLAHTYGDIVQLDLLGRKVIVLNGYDMVHETCDEKRFQKGFAMSLQNVRNLVGDGLFTAYPEEPNWALAHRLLLPAFGTMPIRGMLDDMKDTCEQLLLKWERFGPTQSIDPTDDFTRVALDTLAFCTMSHRLNSFYFESPPAFAQSMGAFLKECYMRSKRPRVVQALMSGTNQKYVSDIDLMNALAKEIVDDRKANPTTKKDLLNLMLNARDPVTGQGLPEENIRNNMLTFMIAGHETSSGMLSFTTYYLLKHPDVMRKLREEIDTVLQGNPLEADQLDKLPYLTAVMRESIRLAPTASMRSMRPLEDTVLGGKYAVNKGDVLLVNTYMQHRDIGVWGNDAEEFRPERMLDGKFEALPPHAWQPFGFGMRACIGRAFAWQEITLILASIIQRFDLSFVDPGYTLRLHQSLTIKPDGLRINARLRTDIKRPGSMLKTLSPSPSSLNIPNLNVPVDPSKPPMYVAYGSNTGTSEAFAQRIAGEAATYGFSARLSTLDAMSGKLPKDGPLVILTASFEGQPADNAGKFVDWLSSLTGSELEGVKYAVFGCGNTEWVQTYQRIPTLCDKTLEERGAERLIDLGAGDVSKSSFFQLFEEWDGRLWKALPEKFATETTTSTEVPALGIEVVDDGGERAGALRQEDTAIGRVVENKLLTVPGQPAKRHIEFELPKGMAYAAGDYLAVLPHNSEAAVHRVLAHFGLPKEQHIVISADGPTALPIGKKVGLVEILSGYVELSQVATTKDLKALAHSTSDACTTRILREMVEDHVGRVLSKRLSVLDILETHPDIKLSLGAFLLMVPAMRVRQYSISSSPLWNPEHVTLTISVLEAPALSGEENKVHYGVASSYLSRLIPGERVRVSVRPSSALFHLPSDTTIPAVLFCAGSGIAPMRGFMQERATQKASGRDVGKVTLFFGCHGPDTDFLYGDVELKEWQESGAVDVRPAFSRQPEKSEGCLHIQDRIYKDKDIVLQAFKDGAKFFTCGSAAVGKSVKGAIIRILAEVHELDETAAVAKYEEVIKGRYATDVFD